MKFENKGKWIKQINESSQKNETNVKSVVAGMPKELAKWLYDEINKWGLSSFDIKDRAALLKEIDNKFHFSKQKNESSSNLQVMLDFSLSEENDAVANYEKRAAKCLEHGNAKLADFFKELARDEKVHVAQLTKAKELLGLADNEIEQEGSDEAKEILTNKGE